jgi:Uma2 family endonuclease
MSTSTTASAPTRRATLVVWDVDPIAESVRKYLASSPDQPIVFHRGDQADAEPAVPGWRISVDRIFS